jgi:hypothetical protein
MLVSVLSDHACHSSPCGGEEAVEIIMIWKALAWALQSIWQQADNRMQLLEVGSVGSGLKAFRPTCQSTHIIMKQVLEPQYYASHWLASLFLLLLSSN